MGFAREFAAIDDVPAVTPSGGERTAKEPPVADDDSLAATALEYSRRIHEFVRSTSPTVSRPVRGQPPPAEALLRFHSRIYFKATRSLVGHRLAASGMTDRHGDANTCAKQTLACIDRSRIALTQFPDAERRGLLALLDAIARGIEARFPDARSVRKLFSVRAA